MTNDCAEMAALVLETAHPGSRATGCARLAGGRNNRVYRLETTRGPFLVKRYFRGGEWDRLRAESAFLRFCTENEIECVSRLVAEDGERGIALHRWLAGRVLRHDEIDSEAIVAAAEFLGELAAASRNTALRAYPAARDACLCLMDFVRSPQQRMGQLAEALANAPASPVWDAANAFFRRRLHPAWENAHSAFLSSVGNDPGALSQPLASAMLVVSPSDFGFHNALRLSDGTLAFVDFEYAGRDSLVKAIADFLCQAEYRLPDPDVALRTLARAALPGGCGSERLEELVHLVLPLTRVKFCCILMNEFKTADSHRRVFAGPEKVDLRRQLAKTKRYLSSL